MTNPIIDLMLAHRSVRQFTAQVISDETVALILQAALTGPNMNNAQPVTFIELTNPKFKQLLTATTGQKQIASAPRTFAVVMDWHKALTGMSATEQAAAKENLANYPYLEGGAVSAGVAVGRALLAAQSLGLAGVTYAGITNAAAELEAQLNLPAFSKVVMGLSFGYPAEDPGIKPKLPIAASWMKDYYDQDSVEAQVAIYNEVMHDYYAQRGSDLNWTQNNVKGLTHPQDWTAKNAYPRDKGFHF